MIDQLRSLLAPAPDERGRGVSTVIGAVLIFGIVIIAWTSYQSIAVPQQNAAAEFNHNQQVQGDLLDLRDGLLRTGVTGVQQSASITVGADYPRRAIAVNFAVTGGRVVTRDPAPDNDNKLVLRNVSATDAETRDYLDGSLDVTTKSIVYSPTYTRYNQAPDTVIAGGAGAVFNEFDRSNLSIADQVLINGRTITVVAIDGNLTKARSGEGATVSVEAQPLSVATRSVTVENSGGRINITLPTRIADEAAWNGSTLESRFGDDGAVHDVKRLNDSYVSVVLEEGQYTLRMMKVGVGNGATEPGAAYLTDVETPAGTVSENSSSKITLEVRDRFNNPVDGVRVNATIDSASGAPSGTLGVVGEAESTSATDTLIDANASNGRVTFNYTAPDVSSKTKIRLNFTISRPPFQAHERVWVNTSVLADGGNDGGGGGGGGGDTASDINPNSTGSVLLTGSSFAGGGSSSPIVADISFENTGSSERNITDVRVAFFFGASPGGGGPGGYTPPTSVDQIVESPSGSPTDFINNSKSYNIPTGFIEVTGQNTGVLDPAGDSGDELTLRVTFDDSSNLNNGEAFFVVGFQFENGEQATYFASISN